MDCTSAIRHGSDLLEAGEEEVEQVGRRSDLGSEPGLGLGRAGERAGELEAGHYPALNASIEAGASTPFIAFMLTFIYDALA